MKPITGYNHDASQDMKLESCGATPTASGLQLVGGERQHGFPRLLPFHRRVTSKAVILHTLRISFFGCAAWLVISDDPESLF